MRIRHKFERLFSVSLENQPDNSEIHVKISLE